MRLFFQTFLSFLLINGLFFPRNGAVGSDPKKEWEAYKIKYGKKYQPTEDAKRMAIFIENKNLIEEHNRHYHDKRTTYKMGINHLTDFRPMDRAVKMMQSKDQIEHHKQITLATFHQTSQTPESKDWRKENAVSRVKKQGECGSCWAFTATGALESHYFIKTKRRQYFSEQYLVDCSRDNGNFGCDGGVVSYAFRQIKKEGIATEDSYPYQELDGVCQKGDIFGGLKVIGYRRTEASNEEQLKHAVGTIGPVTVAIDTNHTSFQLYSNGIHFQADCNTDRPTHAALVVGYGSENGQDYWIVKNSWGPEWGENGYIKMARNKNNNCGIASNAVYPVIEALAYQGNGTYSGANALSLSIHLLLLTVCTLCFWNT